MGNSTDPQASAPASLGRRLRRLRKQRGLTQTELARQIGIQQSDLSRMESGEYRVSLDNLFKILSALGVAVTDFFSDSRPRPAAQQPLSSTDMQLLQMLRQLSPEGRREVHEYVEFKVRREQTERRAVQSRRTGEESS